MTSCSSPPTSPPFPAWRSWSPCWASTCWATVCATRSIPACGATAVGPPLTVILTALTALALICPGRPPPSAGNARYLASASESGRRPAPRRGAQAQIPPNVCRATFGTVRSTERQRAWTLEALVRFWTAVVVRASRSALTAGAARRRSTNATRCSPVSRPVPRPSPALSRPEPGVLRGGVCAG